MDKEKLDELWKQVTYIGKMERLDDNAMVALGSVFSHMRSAIERLKEENNLLSEHCSKLDTTINKKRLYGILDEFIDRSDRYLRDAIERKDDDDMFYYNGQQKIIREIKDRIIKELRE